MADDTTQATEGTTGTTEGQTGAAAQSEPQERTFTQAEVNKLVGDARKKVRAQYQGYDELRAQADAHADYDDIKAERDALAGQIAHRELLDKVSAATGVPATLIHGETEDDMTASANAIAAYAKAQQPAYPTDKGGGANPAPATRESILSIKDPAARRAAIAANLDMFD